MSHSVFACWMFAADWLSGGPANSFSPAKLSQIPSKPVLKEPTSSFAWTLNSVFWAGVGREAKHLFLFLTDCETKSLVATEFAAKKCQLMSSLLENITALRSVPRQTQTLDREHTGLQQNSSHWISSRINGEGCYTEIQRYGSKPTTLVIMNCLNW